MNLDFSPETEAFRSKVRAFFETEPDATVMGSIAILALAANLASVVILMRWREGDANVRSVWLCSRNDAIGNVAVFGSAGLVAFTGTHWPDVIVAGAIGGHVPCWSNGKPGNRCSSASQAS